MNLLQEKTRVIWVGTPRYGRHEGDKGTIIAVDHDDRNMPYLVRFDNTHHELWLHQHDIKESEDYENYNIR